MAALVFVTALLGTACERRDAEPSAPAEATDLEEARTFGELRQPGGPVTALAEIAANATRYEGQQVRTEGEIQRVCQKKGCWLELADAAGTRAFVPMAGHAFAVPMDSVGNDAVVEGTVRRRERSDAEREHLKSDGAGDSIPVLSIEATAVVIR